MIGKVYVVDNINYRFSIQNIKIVYKVVTMSAEHRKTRGLCSIKILCYQNRCVYM